MKNTLSIVNNSVFIQERFFISRNPALLRSRIKICSNAARVISLPVALAIFQCWSVKGE